MNEPTLTDDTSPYWMRLVEMLLVKSAPPMLVLIVVMLALWRVGSWSMEHVVHPIVTAHVNQMHTLTVALDQQTIILDGMKELAAENNKILIENQKMIEQGLE